VETARGTLAIFFLLSRGFWEVERASGEGGEQRVLLEGRGGGGLKVVVILVGRGRGGGGGDTVGTDGVLESLVRCRKPAAGTPRAT